MYTLAVAVGGVLGSLARYAVATAWPAPSGHFPWSTFTVNVTGCLLIGLLLVRLVEVGSAHPLWRPFLGVGVLGGYTTFSTYAVDSRGLLAGDHVVVGLVYVVATVAGALLAVQLGVVAGRAVAGLGRRGA